MTSRYYPSTKVDSYNPSSTTSSSMESPIWGESIKSTNVMNYICNRSLNTSESQSSSNISLALDLKQTLLDLLSPLAMASHTMFFMARHCVLGAMFIGRNKAWALSIHLAARLSHRHLRLSPYSHPNCIAALHVEAYEHSPSYCVGF